MALSPAQSQGGGACPGGCDCDRDSAWCRGGGGGVPRGLPPRLATLSLIRWDIEALPEGSFRHLPALTLLLVASGRLGTIGDGAFAGLGALEYLFIEDTELGAIAPTALRGLRGLLFLSLANNRLESLPPGLFQDLGTLTQLDLRGNPFRCDCHLRWLLRWLPTRPSPAEAGGRCRGPLPHQGTPLALLSPGELQCQRHELRPFQSLPFSSLGAESFALGGQRGVALAQPVTGACALLEWDQLGGRFRAPTIINSEQNGAKNGETGVALAQPVTGACALLEWDQLGGRFRAPTIINTGVALAQPVTGACALLEWDQLGGRFRAPTIINTGVALAQPVTGACALLEWDQLGGRFRAPTIINSSSPVACHPLPVGDTLLVVVAQLGGGSWVWRRSGGPGSSFVRHQALGSGHLRRPHAVAAARLAGHLYLGVADSSKGGTSTVFRWASGGFYPHQTLRPWQRDTHLEFLELGGRPALVVCSAARRPLVYRWSGGGFAPHTDIPHVPDVYAAKHFRVRGSVFLCLTRFLGDAKVMRWEGSMFREVQQVPARGSLVFQPLALAGHRYVLLGNDFAPSRVFRLGPAGRLEPGQELPAPTPRAFVPLTAGHRHFLLATSFKGATQIYAHVTEDIGT
ncbi:leucine-rich repeat LGI family member 4-like [Poecile atricapillus]|uniref:leucine-rich repeat LGI family member 4-like n=1 Tax=Poecile atricapillus TaxID=48891 RepID=UPI002738A8F6|nr:leucine-rich repeat LGI family member 4-like [Poecile atricapillus]